MSGLTVAALAGSQGIVPMLNGYIHD